MASGLSALRHGATMAGAPAGGGDRRQGARPQAGRRPSARLLVSGMASGLSAFRHGATMPGSPAGAGNRRQGARTQLVEGTAAAPSRLRIPLTEETEMFIQPWDAALRPDEWQDWVASTDRFGILAVNNLDPAEAPLVVPTHFTLADDELLIHLARPNPVWPHLEAAAEVRLAAVGDYAYIPTYWRARAGGPDEDGVPTSHHTALQLVGQPAAGA